MVKYSTLKLKSRLGLTFLTGALLFVSCSDGEEPDKVVEPVSVPVRFSSGLSGWVESTRATDGSWEANDQVGIYMVPHVAEASAAAGFSTYSTTANTPYVVSSSGASVSLTVAGGQKEMVYPSDGSNVNFVAYYPYQADTHTTAKANVYKVNVSNQSPAKAIDLLYHKGTGTAYNRDRSGSVTLAFTHQLSKLKIDLVPASGVEADLTGAGLALSGFPATADFNLSTGVLGNVSGTTGTLTPVKVSSSSGGAVFEAIVIPHGGAGTSYTRNVKFTINGTSYSYTLPASGVFKAGTVHSYKFRFTGSKVEPATETVNLGDGGMVSWGDYQMTADKFAFDGLSASRTMNNTVTLSTNAPSVLAWILSGEADDTDAPAWITGVSLSDGAAGNDGWKNYTLTFGTDYNVNPEAAPRTGYIRLEADGLSLPVRVTQTAQAYTTGEPDPPSFNLPADGKTGNTFTIRTNAQDEDIEVTPSEAWITILSKQRGTVADDGTSTWTIGFDVSANASTSPREGQIEVTVGGQPKTVPVSQEAAALYVGEPNPLSFPDLPATGKAGNSFTIRTNARDETIEVTPSEAWITTLPPVRGIVADDGSSTWTVGFDMAANATGSSRSGSITVTVGGQPKTVQVSQVAMYVNEPVPASFANVVASGATGNTFMITTNAPDENITVTTKNTQMITNLSIQRGTVADDGSSTWTIGFDVSANTNASNREADISITIGGVSKTVTVSQVATYVNDPVPSSFNLPAAGRRDNTFTIESNSASSIYSITGGTTPSIITNLTKQRGTVADNGSSTWTVTFDVSANTTTFAREAEISITIGDVTKTVSVSQQATGSLPTHTHDGMANCYMVTPGGNVSFLVSRAYRYDGTTFTNALHTGGEYTGAFDVEVVWQDVTNLVTPAVSGSGNYATVHVQANGSTQGNAVVKIYKADDTYKTPVWSWHIWVTDYTGSATWTNPNQTAHTYTFMDRNLGATEAALSLAGRGLFYQWGRKDPFPGGKSSTAGFAELSKFYGISQTGAGSTTAVTVSGSANADAIVESIQNPTTFYCGTSLTYYYDWLPVPDNYLWSTNGVASGKKTIYDPCPSGWRVPARVNIGSSDNNSPWKGLSEQTFIEGDAGGVNWGTNALFPAAGYRSNSNGSFDYGGSYGYYCSASPPSSYRTRYLTFYFGGVNVNSEGTGRAWGRSVRCAQE